MIALAWLAALASALALTWLMVGDTSSPSPWEFPIGFFSVHTVKDVRMLSATGFNAFQSYQVTPETLLPVAKEVKRQKAILLTSPRQLFKSTVPPSAYGGAVWYLQDEPDVHGLDLADMKEIERKTLKWDPGSKSAFVVGDGSKAANYPNVADAIMVDWYPVPHLPLESAGDHVRMTFEVAGNRPVWAVLQTMDWRDFPQRDPKKKRIGRFPNMNEIRFMTYDAVLNGAMGVWYFAYEVAEHTLSETPEHMFAVNQVARELKTMAPVFSRGRLISLPFPEPKGGFLARAWTYRGSDYVILINRTPNELWRIPDSVLTNDWRPLFVVKRNQHEILKKRKDVYFLQPYDVLVLKSRLQLNRFFSF